MSTAGLLLAGAAVAVADEPPELEVTGMTLMGSRRTGSEMALRARHARLRPESDRAQLRDVVAVVTYDDRRRSLEMTCERAELDLETQDFTAEGDVRGVTGDGQRYTAPWVKYDHREGVFYSDAPVEMVDETGTFRGDGFRFHVDEGRFQLLGNVVVVQTP